MVKINLHGSILPLTPQGIVTGLEVINSIIGQGIADGSAIAGLHPAPCHSWHFSWGFSACNFLIGYKLTLNFTKIYQVVRFEVFFSFPYRCHLMSLSRYNFLIKIKLIKKQIKSKLPMIVLYYNVFNHSSGISWTHVCTAQSWCFPFRAPPRPSAGLSCWTWALRTRLTHEHY